MLKVVVIHLDMFNKQLTYAFLCFQNKNYNTAVKDFSKKTLVRKYKENLKILKLAP